jgi:toxin FitB
MVQRGGDELFLSEVTAAEIEADISKVRRTGSRRAANDLCGWFDRLLIFYADRMLQFDLAAARIAGVFRDAALADGRHPGFAAVAIAAIAKSCSSKSDPESAALRSARVDALSQ